MSTQIDASPFIQLAPRGHRQRIGKEPRVLLASTTVDVSTKAQLKVWQAITDDNLGGVLDAVVSFAKSKGFPRSIHKSNARGSRSTDLTSGSTA